MATIIGGMFTGLSRKNAAKFSFFLAVPTMAAASGYMLLKIVTEPSLIAELTKNLTILLIGNVVAFVVALAAVRLFISFQTRHRFRVFGYYRIVLGLAILAFCLCRQ